MLAGQQQPDHAISMLVTAKAAAGDDQTLVGLADYDEALALFYSGSYIDSADAFHCLISRPNADGFDSDELSLGLLR